MRLRSSRDSTDAESRFPSNVKVPDNVWRSRSGNLLTRHSCQEPACSGTTQVRVAVPMDGHAAPKTRKKARRPTAWKAGRSDAFHACVRLARPARATRSQPLRPSCMSCSLYQSSNAALASACSASWKVAKRPRTQKSNLRITMGNLREAGNFS